MFSDPSRCGRYERLLSDLYSIVSSFCLDGNVIPIASPTVLLKLRKGVVDVERFMEDDLDEVDTDAKYFYCRYTLEWRTSRIYVSPDLLTINISITVKCHAFVLQPKPR
jgi:hypothetical protein